MLVVHGLGLYASWECEEKGLSEMPVVGILSLRARRIFGAISLALGMACAAPAAAQFADLFRPTNLSAQDIEMARLSALSLYDKRLPQYGDHAQWQNPASGAAGKVRIVEVNAEGDCIILQHTAKASADAAELSLRFKRCRDGEGNWQLIE